MLLGAVKSAACSVRDAFCFAFSAVPFFLFCSTGRGASTGAGFSGQYALSFGRRGGGPSTSVLRASLSERPTVAEGAKRTAGTFCCPFDVSPFEESAGAVPGVVREDAVLAPILCGESRDAPGPPSDGEDPCAGGPFGRDIWRWASRKAIVFPRTATSNQFDGVDGANVETGSCVVMSTKPTVRRKLVRKDLIYRINPLQKKADR